MSDIARKQDQVRAVLRLAPVVAVVVVQDVRSAVSLARALCEGGIRAIEITLRTPVAMDAIAAIAQEVDGAVVGAGTVRTVQDLRGCAERGGRFAVSPGHTLNLLDAADDCAMPYLPGAVTASEAMKLAERGYFVQKFFPAVAAGGIDYLRSLAGPLPDVTFCATGGVSAATTPDWLALPNLLAVGGSWLTPSKLIEAGDWAAITALARTAAQLRAS
ncbi:MAG: bifunctional 4-hydroxy-2-oxoglutarate aldolase/2-dehydro-3-deoxy-phosphogluconate aldolase [Tahibacter sp.]